METLPKILITRNNNNLGLILGSKHYSFIDERAAEIFPLAMEYYKNRTEENLETLQAILNPILRKEVAEVLTTDGEKFYLGQTKTPIPSSLAEEIVEFASKGYPTQSLINFWKRALLNPNSQARDDFFAYCKKFGVTITESGYAVLYKAVNKRTVAANTGLAEFVSESWLKVKRWKKAPRNYTVFKNEGDYGISDGTVVEQDGAEILGNLQDMHNSLGDLVASDSLTFVPSRQGSHGNEIVLGSKVWMPREQCDPQIENACSYGLHVGSFEYVSSFGRNMDTILACLVNPTDVVAIPAYDTSKMRVCEYTPYAIIERKEDNSWEELESSFFETEEEVANIDEEFINMDSLHLNEENITEFKSTRIQKEIHLNQTDLEFDEFDEDEFDDLDDEYFYDN